MSTILHLYSCDSTSMNELIQFRNFLHSAFKFTKEDESNNKFAFLDVLIILFIHYSSFVPISCKIGLVKTLSHRAYKICSDKFIDVEPQFITETLSKVGYMSELFKNIQRDIHLYRDKEIAPQKKEVVIKIFSRVITISHHRKVAFESKLEGYICKHKSISLLPPQRYRQKV